MVTPHKSLCDYAGQGHLLDPKKAEGSHSGLVRLLGEQVRVNSPSWVQIPHPPLFSGLGE